MPKAHLTMKDGTKLVIEGTHDEIVVLLERLQGNPIGDQPKGVSARPRSKAKSTPVGVISELIESGFFKKPKELSAIKDALEERGHFYPTTTLSPTVLRLVKKKELRRIKENKRWKYVG
jgi:hypothetical protein